MFSYLSPVEKLDGSTVRANRESQSKVFLTGFVPSPPAYCETSHFTQVAHDGFTFICCIKLIGCRIYHLKLKLNTNAGNLSKC
jgi:hypothetical protein